MFTRIGRARRYLSQAFRADDGGRAVKLGEKAIACLQGRGAPEGPKPLALMHEILVFLAWRNLQRQAWEETANWLAILDQQFPDAPERIGVRWALMGQLLAIGNLAGYLQQTQILLADAQTTMERYGAAVLEVISILYSRLSPVTCESQISGANPALRQSVALTAVVNLCRCPPNFALADEARSWSDRIDLQCLGFSTLLEADALVLKARAAEWTGEWTEMVKLTERALLAAPERMMVRYWAVRARLHLPGGHPEQLLGTPGLPDSEEWQRLGILVRLYTHPGLDEAQAALPILSQHYGPIDQAERNLVVDVMKPALTVSDKWNSAETTRCADICQELENRVGRLPWAQISIAIKQIRVARQYAAAAERLEQESVLRAPQAESLATLARLLAKMPVRSGATLNDACSRLAEIDDRFPHWGERLLARRNLIVDLAKSNDYARFLEQGRKFFVDPLTGQYLGRMQKLDKVLFQVAATVYKQFSPAICGDVVSAADSRLRADQTLAMLLAICRCPPKFCSRDEAISWARKVSPESLTVSARIQADALLIKARATEWKGEWNAMENLACHAMALMPECVSARYWLARARLHVPRSRPADALAGVAAPSAAEWVRLKHQIALHEEPTLQNAEAMMSLLDPREHAADPQERELILELLRPALMVDWNRTPAEMTRCAVLCRDLEQMMGILPWAELSIAATEIQVDRQYAAALPRLENHGVAPLPQASELRMICGILLGTSISSGGAENGDLAVIEASARRILCDKTQSDAGTDAALSRRLGETHASPWCKRIPVLAATVGVLQMALKVFLSCDGSRLAPLEECRARDCPPWVHWLWTRSVLIEHAQSKAPSSLAILDGNRPSQAWLLEQWWSLYGRDGANPPRTAEISEEQSETLTLPQKHGETLAIIRELRAGNLVEGLLSRIHPIALAIIRELRAGDTQAPLPKPIAVKSADTLWDLGHWCDSAAWLDLGVELTFHIARRKLLADRVGKAWEDFEQLSQRLASVPPVIFVLWQPAIQYWHAVGLARTDSRRAQTQFESLVRGPKGEDARVQLAMLAIKENRLEEADTWLVGVEHVSPGRVYATALLHARRGNLTEARTLLDSFHDNFGATTSPYHLASRRLLAALAERSDCAMEAERLHRETLEQYPDDPVTSARLGRSILHDAYVSFRKDRALEDRTVRSPPWNPVPRIESDITWWPPYTLFCDLINEPDHSLPGLDKPVNSLFGCDDRSVAWRQMLASRFIFAGRPNEGLQILTACRQKNVPPWFQRTRLLLQTWRALERLAGETSREGASNELTRCLQGFEELGAADAATIQWRTLAELGTNLSGGAPIVRWRELAPHPMAHLPFLFDADSQLRQAAAESLVPLLGSDGAGWNEEQRLLLQALAAWACKMDDAYLEQYARLEPILEKLPVHERDLWAQAALIRYSRADWTSLTGDRLPDCLADMSDPLVCLILELADARATVGDLKNLNQRVAQKIKGIQSNLAALVEKLDAQKSEAASS